MKYLPESIQKEMVLEYHKNNCEVIVSRLISDYTDYLWYLSQRYFLQGATSEDLVQEGRIGLYKAIKSYNIDKGDFIPYAQKCIYAAIFSAIRQYNRVKHSMLSNAISLYQEIKDNKNTDNRVLLEIIIVESNILGKDSLSKVIEREDYIEFSQYINDNLTELEQTILQYRIYGLSYTEISTLTNREEKSIDNALTRAKKKLENYTRVKQLKERVR